MLVQHKGGEITSMQGTLIRLIYPALRIAKGIIREGVAQSLALLRSQNDIKDFSNTYSVCIHVHVPLTYKVRWKEAQMFEVRDIRMNIFWLITLTTTHGGSVLPLNPISFHKWSDFANLLSKKSPKVLETPETSNRLGYSGPSEDFVDYLHSSRNTLGRL